MKSFKPMDLLKTGSNTGAFLWILRNFKEHIFWRTSANGCFWLFLFWSIFSLDVLIKLFLEKGCTSKLTEELFSSSPLTFGSRDNKKSDYISYKVMNAVTKRRGVLQNIYSENLPLFGKKYIKLCKTSRNFQYFY